MSTERPLIVADIGNSAVKLACYLSRDRAAFCQATRILRYDANDVAIHQIRDELPSAACDWRVASVHRAAEHQLAQWVRENRAKDRYQLLTHVDFPVNINVDQPHRVGGDRLATATAACELSDPSHVSIIVDAGTAITVDVIDPTGTFQGGVILPGRHAFPQALASSTDLLPLVSANDEMPLLPGKNTEAAIAAGSYWGTVGAVRQVISALSAAHGKAVEIFVTGGDGSRIHQYLERKSQLVPHLAVMGIALTSLPDN